MSRSAAQQVAHWARIGRELESSDTVSHREIRDVLGAAGPTTTFVPASRPWRAEWAERTTLMREGLDFAEEFARPVTPTPGWGRMIRSFTSTPWWWRRRSGSASGCRSACDVGAPSGDPVLHLLAGPNGAGKRTLAERVILPVTHLPFVNADVLAPVADCYRVRFRSIVLALPGDVQEEPSPEPVTGSR